MSEQPRPVPAQEVISRRQFFRRMSYMTGAVSAILIGDGAHIVIDASNLDPKTRRYELPAGVTIQSDEPIKPLGQVIGGIILVGGLACAHASYLLNRGPNPD